MPGVLTPGNIGYGTAANVGFCALRAMGCAEEWLIVSNDDATPSAAALVWLSLVGREADAEVLAFQLVDDDNVPVRSFGTFPAPLFRLSKDREPSSYPKGAFFAIRTPAFIGLGGFDPTFFLYYEEADLLYRLFQSGGRTVVAPKDAVVSHRGGATTSEAAIVTGFELGRSAALFARKHYTQRSIRSSRFIRFLIEYDAVIVRRLIARDVPGACRGAASIAGLLVGGVSQTFEPLQHTRLHAVSAAQRAIVNAQAWGY